MRSQLHFGELISKRVPSYAKAARSRCQNTRPEHATFDLGATVHLCMGFGCHTSRYCKQSIFGTGPLQLCPVFSIYVGIWKLASVPCRLKLKPLCCAENISTNLASQLKVSTFHPKLIGNIWITPTSTNFNNSVCTKKTFFRLHLYPVNEYIHLSNQ